MTAYVPPGEWSGDPLERPGLMLRKWQVEEILAADQAAEPEREPDRVLAHRRITDITELTTLVGGAKLLLGVTKQYPRGQLVTGWTWTASHGYGQDGATGAIRESVLVKIERRAGIAPARRAVAWWARPVPHPALMLALARAAGRWEHGGRVPRLVPPIVAAVLRQLPRSTWSSELLAAAPIDGNGRFVDVPRVMPAAELKKELRS